MPGSTRSYEIARRLVDKGHTVSVVTSARAGLEKRWTVTNEAGIEVHWLGVHYSNHMAYRQRIGAFLSFAFHSARRAAAIRADLVFATSTPLTIAVPGVYAAKRSSVPMVFEVRDLWPEVPIAIGVLTNPAFKIAAKWLERWAYGNSEAVIALSPGMRDGVVRAGYDARRIAIIPNSSDVREFGVECDRRLAWRAKRPWLKDRPLLTYPGTFGRINGVDYLIPVARVLRDSFPELRILLIGDGVEKAAVQAKAAEANVLNVNVFFEDQVPKAEMPDVFAGSDMICSLVIDIPELFANSANKVFDTFAAGKPILINHGGWQAEIIRASGCGLVTAGLKFYEAAQLIGDRLKDKNWLARAGDASKKLALDHFGRDRLVDQLNEVLLAASKHEGHMASMIAPGVCMPKSHNDKV
jgi:glycosyltransferase involved in cell wall biosynthesis